MVVVLLCVVVGASSVFVFLCVSPTLLSIFFITFFVTIYQYFSFIIIVVVYIIVIFSTELLALCDGCLAWGWVWRVGLMAGLWVGQAFGMFLLPGFGVSSSSPWVPKLHVRLRH